MTDSYIMGYSEAYLRILSSRSVANSCGYLSERLRPGFRVLDVGCGPGSISVGIAEMVGPTGELHGIDIEPSQAEMAARATRERGLGNAYFRVADVQALPFEDDYFDLVHCSGVLSYVPDTGAALKKIKRVLKSGGILACQEIIMDSFLIHPDPKGIQTRGYGVFADVLAVFLAALWVTFLLTFFFAFFLALAIGSAPSLDVRTDNRTGLRERQGLGMLEEYRGRLS